MRKKIQTHLKLLHSIYRKISGLSFLDRSIALADVDILMAEILPTDVVTKIYMKSSQIFISVFLFCLFFFYRLAAMELARFQDQLVKRIGDEIAMQNGGTYTGPNMGAVMIPAAIQEYEWTFARAFLYSLTVLTTIGK